MKDYEAKKNIFPDRKAVNTERKKILKLTILYGVATLALWKALGPASLIVSLPLLLAVVLHAQAKATLILHRSIENHHFFIMRQNQALNSLHSILGSDRPLPVFGQWAIDPDFAQLIMDKIILNQPATILELGSGLSTVIAGLTQKKIGKGQVLSIEHNESYARTIREQLDHYGLAGSVSIIHCPLEDIEIDSRQFSWYDLSVVLEIPTVDLLIVDGPPGKLQSFSRYPALPLLHQHLSPNAVILLDDARREDERSTVESWVQQYQDLAAQFIETQKGAFVITRGIDTD